VIGKNMIDIRFGGVVGWGSKGSKVQRFKSSKVQGFKGSTFI
jgi:hypothetical protein